MKDSVEESLQVAGGKTGWSAVFVEQPCSAVAVAFYVRCRNLDLMGNDTKDLVIDPPAICRKFFIFSGPVHQIYSKFLLESTMERLLEMKDDAPFEDEKNR